MLHPDSVPFGKYKDQPITELLSDQSYLDWIATQPEIIEYLKTSHPEIFTLVSRHTIQDSVEHNQLQARFLDDDFFQAFLHTLGAKPLKNHAHKNMPELNRDDFQEYWGLEFECGYDVRIWTWFAAKLWTETTAKAPPSQEFRIEIKPSLGDDYPNVLRQIKKSNANMLLFDRFQSNAINIKQLSRFFRLSHVAILPFSAIKPAPKSDNS